MIPDHERNERLAVKMGWIRTPWTLTKWGHPTNEKKFIRLTSDFSGSDEAAMKWLLPWLKAKLERMVTAEFLLLPQLTVAGSAPSPSEEGTYARLEANQN